MQIERTLPDGKTKFVLEAATPKEAFIKLALVDSLFSETDCGCCQSKSIRFEKRDIDNGFYLGMRCDSCSATLDYGQLKEGDGIYVKKWDKENRRPLPNRGWHIYQRQGGSSEAPRGKPDSNVPF